MSIEKGDIKPWPKNIQVGKEHLSPMDYPETYQKQLDSIRRRMEGLGLDPDATRNILNGIDLIAEVDITELQPVQYYEEWLRSQDVFDDHAESKLKIELSDPKGIVEFNALIDEFNAQINRLKKEKDKESIKKIISRGIKISEKYNA